MLSDSAIQGQKSPNSDTSTIVHNSSASVSTDVANIPDLGVADAEGNNVSLNFNNEKRYCSICLQWAYHDARNCPKKL
jgi:hypothetical protein